MPKSCSIPWLVPLDRKHARQQAARTKICSPSLRSATDRLLYQPPCNACAVESNWVRTGRIAGFTQLCCRTPGPFCTALSGMHAGPLDIALEVLAALFGRVTTFQAMLCKQQGWQRHMQQAVGQVAKHCMSTFSQGRACQFLCIKDDCLLSWRAHSMTLEMSFTGDVASTLSFSKLNFAATV